MYQPLAVSVIPSSLLHLCSDSTVIEVGNVCGVTTSYQWFNCLPPFMAPCNGIVKICVE